MSLCPQFGRRRRSVLQEAESTQGAYEVHIRKYRVTVLAVVAVGFLLVLSMLGADAYTGRHYYGRLVVTAPVDSQIGALSVEDAKKLKNPVPYTKKSVAAGRNIFVRRCTACHGMDGKAMVDVVADATDLTSPKLWKSGTSDGEILRSIRDGAGASMPSFKSEIRQEEDLWNLVNYVRSLWPESTRPELKEGH